MSRVNAPVHKASVRERLAAKLRTGHDADDIKGAKVRRKAENKLKVVAVRVDPEIEQRLRLLAEVTGRKQSFFLQQLIESGMSAMEEVWLPPAVLAQVREGVLPSPLSSSGATSDLFADLIDENT